MESSNNRLTSSSSSSGKKMIKLHRTKAMRKMRAIEEIYTTAPHCTVEDLDRRNGVQLETNENNRSFTSCSRHPDRIGRDKEAKPLKVDGEKKINDVTSAEFENKRKKLRNQQSISSDDNSKQPRILMMKKHTTKEAKLLKVDGEMKINDVATSRKSVGIKRSSSSSNGETSTSVAIENEKKKLRNQQSISSNDNSKQLGILMKKHTTKEENKMELSDNHHTISDSSLVKDQARAGPNLLQLSDSVLEDFDIYCKKEVSMDSEAGKGSNSLLKEIHIPGPPGSFLPSPDHDRGNSLSLPTSNDLIDKDSSDSLMSAATSIIFASKSPETDIHKEPAAFTVIRLMGKDLIVVNIATE